MGSRSSLLDGARPPIHALIDLSGRPALSLEQEAYTLARREAHIPFDLREGPLIRLLVLRLGPQSHILLVTLHQIICDGWSLGLFARELSTCYGAICNGATPELEPLGLQYGDYAVWQRQWLDSNGFTQRLSYWTRKLSGANLLLDLSANVVRPTEPKSGS